ncbi:MAG: hypothetical protein KIT31_19460 [Deltaproteobacteria bacterium]|nr:hypothetical protein [Deltaproteobacteria bacterium]
MARDLGRLAPVAWLLIALGCGPTVRPPEPPSEPGSVTKQQDRGKLVPSTVGRQIMVGEMCPQGAGGRPAVTPLVMRGATWTDAQADLSNVVERGGVPRFVVFGVDGKHAGIFDTVGLTDVGLGQAVASGTYTGAAPCTSDAGNGQRSEEVLCTPATGGCGLAVGELSRPDEPPMDTTFTMGGACISGDALAVDIDGDGKMESFPLAGILDGVRSPAHEWTAAPTATAACKPTFQIYNLRLAPPPEPGKPANPKHVVTLHVLGVLDLDGDGRREVVVAFEFPTVRTIAVYSATASPQRLELAGEGTSFPHLN